ncbi:MAG: hypothetical protein JSW26_01360 [Desulfobacterales bacterium]|nr:MAG: hypothetical protein JSW26_01360 [Desulfobacterales bacterium]
MVVKGSRLWWLAGYVILALLTLTACGTTESVITDNEETDARIQMEKKAPADKGHAYNIPPEYMPPPGKCRIWFPGRPPEYQPPPGECADLERQLPLNTWLLRGAKE